MESLELSLKHNIGESNFNEKLANFTTCQIVF